MWVSFDATRLAIFDTITITPDTTFAFKSAAFAVVFSGLVTDTDINDCPPLIDVNYAPSPLINPIDELPTGFCATPLSDMTVGDYLLVAYCDSDLGVGVAVSPGSVTFLTSFSATVTGTQLYASLYGVEAV